MATKETKIIRTWTRGERHSRLLSIPNSSNVVDLVTNENNIHKESIINVNDTNCTGSLIESPHADQADGIPNDETDQINAQSQRVTCTPTNSSNTGFSPSYMQLYSKLEVELSNYMCYRGDRCSRRGGGVILYIHYILWRHYLKRNHLMILKLCGQLIST
ncbi:hypothetical protein GJ496_009588 [Pomphorhynchus laevis]|nr:hypothetical protein GJ496_009588 [Pomphorhynchus laevis]